MLLLLLYVMESFTICLIQVMKQKPCFINASSLTLNNICQQNEGKEEDAWMQGGGCMNAHEWQALVTRERFLHCRFLSLHFSVEWRGLQVSLGFLQKGNVTSLPGLHICWNRKLWGEELPGISRYYRTWKQREGLGAWKEKMACDFLSAKPSGDHEGSQATAILKEFHQSAVQGIPVF